MTSARRSGNYEPIWHGTHAAAAVVFSIHWQDREAHAMNKSDKYQRWDHYHRHPILRRGAGDWEFVVAEVAPFKRKSRVVIYHRASGPKDPLRIAQLAACQQYCTHNGFRVEATFQDTRPEPFDISAVLEKYGQEEVGRRITERHQRPEWDKAKAAIKEGRADIIVVYSPDHVFHVSEKRTLAYQLCYLPPVAFVEPWQDTEEEQASER
jgi:hypothetical protein